MKKITAFRSQRPTSVIFATVEEAAFDSMLWHLECSMEGPFATMSTKLISAAELAALLKDHGYQICDTYQKYRAELEENEQ